MEKQKLTGKGSSKNSVAAKAKVAAALKAKRVKTAQLEQNVVDLILLDHKFLKECIEVLTDEKADRRKILTTGKKFLEVLAKHSVAEEKSIYPALEGKAGFHFNILESEIEHGIVDQKVSMLKPKLARVKTTNDELAAELKVCAELVKHHIREEESELLPKINKEVPEEKLLELGAKFAKARKFTEEELEEFPKLAVALQVWKSEMEDLSQKFVSKIDGYVKSLTH